MDIFKMGEKAHELIKERDKNLLRTKVIEAIKNNVFTPEAIMESTSLNEIEVDTVLTSLEEEGYILCRRGGSKLTPWDFEVIKSLP